MGISKERVKELRSQSYLTLQSTDEFKDYLARFVYSQSKNLTSEVEYILKRSYEDEEAPFSYEDIDLNSFDIDELKKAIIEDIETNTEETNKDLFDEINELNGTTIKTMQSFIVFLNGLNLQEVKDFIDNEYNQYLAINIYDYEQQTEVFQWFLMDDRLLHQLEERDEIVLNGMFWGRQCCGQSIEMDYVIIQIFKEWYLELYGVCEE